MIIFAQLAVVLKQHATGICAINFGSFFGVDLCFEGKYHVLPQGRYDLTTFHPVFSFSSGGAMPT